MQRRTITDKLTRSPRTGPPSGKTPLSIGDLSGQAQSVLATLVLAVTWQTRFPGGWVSLEAFQDWAIQIGQNERDNSGKAIRRGIEQILLLDDPPNIQTRPAPGNPRAIQWRLTEPVAETFVIWLLGDGDSNIVPTKWSEFLNANYRPYSTLSDIREVLEESAILRRMVDNKGDEAIRLARDGLARNSDPRLRPILSLALSKALIWRDAAGDIVEAEQILRNLLEDKTLPVDLQDVMTRATIRLNLAELILDYHVFDHDDAPQVRAAITGIHGLLNEASRLRHSLDHRKVGWISLIEARVKQWEAQNANEDEERRGLYRKAERYFQRAFSICRLDADAQGIGVALHGLANIRLSRLIFNIVPRSEDFIRETVEWYELSISYSKLSPELPDWHDWRDHAMAAYALSLLVSLLADAKRFEEVGPVMEYAVDHLAFASEILNARGQSTDNLKDLADIVFGTYYAFCPPLPVLTLEKLKERDPQA